MQGKPLTAMCWGHNDRRLFLAAGFNLFVAWVIKQTAPLQFMCQRTIQNCVRSEKNTHILPLPPSLRHGVQSLFSPTIKVRIKTVIDNYTSVLLSHRWIFSVSVAYLGYCKLSFSVT